jgi:hypothetical protein
MLEEIINLAEFGKELADIRKAEVKDWRCFYELYCRLGDVIDASVIAVESRLPVPPDAPFLVNTSSFPSPVAKWVYCVNEQFQRLDSAVVAFLHAYRQLEEFIDIFDADLRIHFLYHFWCKSHWSELFEEKFCSGRLSDDGKRLCKTALRLADRITGHPFGVPDAFTETLVVSEEYDTTYLEARQKLVIAGRSDIETLKAIQFDWAAFIEKNCQMQDLLYWPNRVGHFTRGGHRSSCNIVI